MGEESPSPVDIQAILVHPDAATNTPEPPQTSWSVAVLVGDATSSGRIPMESASTSFRNVPMWQQAKRGSKCCGCCCDFRRAVIILAIIRLGFLAFCLSFTTEFDDTEGLFVAALFTIVVYISMTIFSIVGALTYKICPIATDLVLCVGKYYTSYDSSLVVEGLGHLQTRSFFMILGYWFMKSLFCRLIFFSLLLDRL